MKNRILLKEKHKESWLRKKNALEFIVGDELSVSLNKWVYKNRTIDSVNNNYQELVIDLNIGNVIHQCDEPLSEHYGQGTAKFKKN